MVCTRAVNISEDAESFTFMSKFINFLIWIKFFPIQKDQNNQKAIFKLFSPATLVFIIIYLGVPSCFVMLNKFLLTEISQAFLIMNGNLNIIDTISIYGCNVISLTTFYLCPLFFVKGIPSAPSLTLARDLMWPKNGCMFVTSFILDCLGYFVSYNSMVFDAIEGKNIKQTTVTLSSIMPMSYLFPSVCFWLIPSLSVSAWMEKIILLCNKKSSSKINHAKFCIGLFSDINSGFGFFFLYVFAVTQFLSIFAFFVVISWPLSADGFILSRLVYSFGVLCLCAGTILNIITLTWKLDSAYQALKNMTMPLQEYLVTIQGDENLRQEIKNIINDIRYTGPFSGKGLFSITRSTLTGMFSIAVTYIIILVQFKMSVA